MNNGGTVATKGLDYVSSLTDDDLYQKLRDLGDMVGPIVGSTRSLYERRLFNLLNGVMMGLNEREQQMIIEPPSEPRQTTIVDNGRHSQNEEQILRQRTTQQSNSVKAQSPSSSEEGEEDEVEEEQERVSPLDYPEYETSLSSYVASPRRGFYSSTETSPNSPSSYMSMLQSGSLVNNCSGTVLKNNFNLKSSSHKIDDPSNKKSLKKTHPMITTMFEIFIVCFLLVVGYIFYQEIIMYSKAEKEFIESNGQNFPNQ